MAVLVTVGTTSFDALIQEVNKISFHSTLFNLGYRTLFIQYGNGCIEPFHFKKSTTSSVSIDSGFLEIHSFRYHNSLDEILRECSLVISHGGAGTCMEALTPPGQRKLIVVVNDSLMHNHQGELANSLSNGRHAFVTTPTDLILFLSTGIQMASSKNQNHISQSPVDVNVLLGPSSKPESVGLVPFHRGNTRALLNYLDEILGLTGA